MAGKKSKAVNKKVEFFRRRWEMAIDSFKSHKPPNASREIRATVKMPLMNKGAVGIPELIAEDVAKMSVEGCSKTSAGYEDVFDGMSLACFTTDDVKSTMRIPNVNAGGTRAASFNGCRIEGLELRKEEKKKGEDEVYLHMNIFFPADKDVLCFLYDQQYGSVFVEFDATQASMVYAGEDEKKADGPQLLLDPNDNPDEPIPGDTREVTPATSKPAKKASKKAVVH